MENKKMNAMIDKADTGAQSSWKGYSSQTLYIAHRIIEDYETNKEIEYCPEQVEDLVIKENGNIVEAIQVKNLSSALTLSSLASAKESKNESGFFQRTRTLYQSSPNIGSVKVIYFGSLGDELSQLENGNKACYDTVFRKITENHNLSAKEAQWLLDKLVFEKAEVTTLEKELLAFFSQIIPTMAAPELALNLMTQYVADLSKNRASTSYNLWQDKIHSIGQDISSIDGYFKEYGKSLIRLTDIASDQPVETLSKEYKQGVAVHPEHIRLSLDFRRDSWLDEIKNGFDFHAAVIVKGISGQGKSSLCLRYLVDNHSEEMVFCVYHVKTIDQANNIACAVKGISKHTKNMVLFIDVYPGEREWTALLQELQLQKCDIPILVSIREEDYKQSSIDLSAVSLGIIELSLTTLEAQRIYERHIEKNPHTTFRSFEEAWGLFGAQGPFLEFVYLLNNNETLHDRLKSQIEALKREGHPDSWFHLLHLTCYAGRIGCPLLLTEVIFRAKCDTSIAALNRLANEYLLKVTEDNTYLESVHPVRARILCEILDSDTDLKNSELLLDTLYCCEDRYPQLLLMDYFTNHQYDDQLIKQLQSIPLRNWAMAAGIIKTMLWLAVKQYTEINMDLYTEIIEKYGDGWLMYSPIDITGELAPNTNELIIESIIETLPAENFDIEGIKKRIVDIKSKLNDSSIDYTALTNYLNAVVLPVSAPTSDSEWSDLGYVLFWCAKRGKTVSVENLKKAYQSAAETCFLDNLIDAYYALQMHCGTQALTEQHEIVKNRLIAENRVIVWHVSEAEITCKFAPNLFTDTTDSHIKNFNNYWRVKMSQWLLKLYPNHEQAYVELLGVNLFEELNIPTLENIANIKRDKLPLSWVTEVNGWMKTRVDYFHRPQDWNEFVQHIKNIREHALRIIQSIINALEYTYAHQKAHKVKNDVMIADFKEFVQLNNKQLLLPKSSVDPYCLLREDNKSDAQINRQSEDVTMVSQSLYIYLYRDFNQAFHDTFSHLQNFLNTALDIFLSRIKQTDLDDVNKAKLSLVNIYDTSVSLDKLQKEYEDLFSAYSENEYDSFEQKERDKYQILLNMWAHVVANPIRKMSIEYDAKLRCRKAQQAVESKFSEFAKTLDNVVMIDIPNQQSKCYLIKELELTDNKTLDIQCQEICNELRKYWYKAFEYGSEKWYIETTWPDIAIVFLLSGIPMNGGAFQIPKHRIINDGSSLYESALYPEILPEEFYESAGFDSLKQQTWQDTVATLSAIRLYIIQYNAIIDVINDCEEAWIDVNGLQPYVQNIVNLVIEQLNQFKIPDDFQVIAESKFNEAQETLDQIQKVAAELDSVFKLMSKLERLSSLPDILNTAVIYLTLLYQYEV